MSFVHRLVAPSLFVSLLAGCATSPVSQTASAPDVEIRPLSESLPWNAGWTTASARADGYWLVSYADMPELNLTAPDGTVTTLIDGGDEDQAPSGLAVAADGDNIWVAYRNKEPERDVFVRREGAAPIEAFGVSGDTMALARLQLHAGPNGLDAIWYGEKPTDGNFYNIFTSRIGADGRLQGEPQAVLPGIYPVWLNDAAGNQGVFSWVQDAPGSRIMMRSRLAGQTGFSEPRLVRTTTPSMTLPFEAFVSGGRWFVFWIAQYGETQDEYLVEGAWSDDLGANWTTFDLESLRGVGIESVSIAANGREIAIAMGVAERDAPRADFRDVRIVRSEDNGTTWLPAQRLRDDAARYARARAPKVAFLGDQRLFVMWEDWREIRSRARYSLSEDSGRSWAVSDARLPVREGMSNVINLFARDIIPTGDGGADLVFEEMSDQFLRKELVSFRLDADALLKPMPNPQPTLAGLEERIKAYWDALIKEEYRTAYSELDPFYRARVPYAEYLQQMGRIEYEAFEINEIVQEGHLARVRQTVTAGVPPYFNRGKLVEVPKWPRPINTTWMWVDGEWVLEFHPDAREGYRFARY